MDSRKDASAAKLANSSSLSIFAYCIASISMTVVNKYCVSGQQWNLNFFYLAFQAVVCLAAVIVCKSMGWADLSGFDKEKARKWLPNCLAFVGMIYTSTKALQFLSVPVYTIFKNLTIIVIAYGEALWFGATVSSMALASFGLMVLSSIVAAWSDIQLALNAPHLTDPGKTSAAVVSTLNAGYFWMFMNVICTASYALGMRRVIKKLGFKDWDTMFYNNLLTIPILLVCSLLFEDWSVANIQRNFPLAHRQAQLIAMTYSGLAAVLISYATAWCVRTTSSTTYSMVGALNKLPLALSGLVFFGTPATFGNVTAIFLGFVSGMMYTWTKVRQTEIAAKQRLPVHEAKNSNGGPQEKSG